MSSLASIRYHESTDHPAWPEWNTRRTPDEARMSKPDNLGGIIHTYQKYDPVQFPSPTAPPPDMVSPAFEHLLHYGSMRRLTEEELARAVHIDPSQIRGLGPSLESLMAMLRERKRKILETYETGQVAERGASQLPRSGRRKRSRRPSSRRAFDEAVRDEQLHDLEQSLVSRRRRERPVRPATAAPGRARSARNIRSMNWRRSTSSPAARR